jgi:hypothetical protein
VTERLFEREVFFHAALYEALRHPWAEEICTAFEKVWKHREALASVADDGTRSVRRA